MRDMGYWNIKQKIRLRNRVVFKIEKSVYPELLRVFVWV